MQYKFLKCFVIILIFSSPFVYAQNDSKILLFDGGNIDGDVSMSSSLFWGIGGKSANLGGSISAFEPDGTIAYWNPARLSMLQSNVLQVDYNPPLGVNVGSLANIDEKIKTATDNGIADYRDESLTPVYSRIGARMYQQGRLGSGVLAIPVNDYAFAVYFHRPLELALSSIMSGIRTQIVTLLEGDKVFFSSYLDGHVSMQIGVNCVGFSGSKIINSQWSVGLAVERYDFSVRTNGRLDVEGSMLFGGKENIFNDPNDSWYNNLNQYINANYTGSDWGWKIACSFDLNDNFKFDTVFEWAPNVTARGNMEFINNTVPAINLGFGDSGDSEILNPEKLKLSQMTLTKRVDGNVYQKLELNLPKTLKLGAAMKTSWVALHLNYALGFSPVSFVYGNDEIGIKPSHILRLGLDFKYVQTALGFAILNKVAKGSETLGENGTTTMLPLFSLGTGLEFSQNYRADFQVFAVPMPILKLSLGIRF